MQDRRRTGVLASDTQGVAITAVEPANGTAKLLATVLNEKVAEEAWKLEVLARVARSSVYLRTTDRPDVVYLESREGQLTVCSGEGPRAKVTIHLKSKSIPKLIGVPIGPFRLPALWAGRGREVTRLLLHRDVKVAGLLTHLPTVIRLLQLLAAPQPH